jgi:hypothetical protein
MTHKKKFANIEILRLAEFLGLAYQKPGTVGHASFRRSLEEDRSYFITHAACFRRELGTRYKPASYDAKQAIKDDNYNYLRFLKKDL